MKTYQKQIEYNLNVIIEFNKGHDQESESSLFGLRTIKPNHSDKTKFVNLGPLLGKKYFNCFLNAIKKEMGFSIDGCVYSRMCVEVSKVDENHYIEISLNKICNLPIAGNQFYILDRHAAKNEMSLIGYIDSLNFILNDERNFL